MPDWWDRMFHPAPALLLRYAESALPPQEAGRVRAHVHKCKRCWRELQLNDETLSWLSRILKQDPAAVLSGIRERLIAEVRAQSPELDTGVCVRVCLGPRSFAEMARRVRRFRGGPPRPIEVAAPLLASFIGRKAIPQNARL